VEKKYVKKMVQKFLSRDPTKIKWRETVEEF